MNINIDKEKIRKGRAIIRILSFVLLSLSIFSTMIVIIVRKLIEAGILIFN